MSIHWVRQEVTKGERTLSCRCRSQLCLGRGAGRQDQSSEPLPHRAAKFICWTYWKSTVSCL